MAKIRLVQVRSLQVHAGQVCVREIDTAEIRFGSGVPAGLDPDFVLVQYLRKFEKRLSSCAIFRGVLCVNFLLNL